jgi:tRNA (uracil-5-)-methyltransferase
VLFVVCGVFISYSSHCHCHCHCRALQVNTPCAELLYSNVMSAMRGAGKADAAVDTAAASTSSTPPPSDNSNLLCLDVCSGTGTIGICCAKSAMGHMIGVELCQAAVNDAIDNATLNGLTLFTGEKSTSTPAAGAKEKSSSSEDANEEGEEEAGGKEDCRVNKYECGFICSRAEAVLESLIGHKRAKPGVGVDLRPFQAMAQGKQVLAVVDPPREGLHVDCLRAIRNCSRIDRLVYVSCNPTKSLPRDVAMLCGPSNKKLPGRAFRPVSATPVDLFPHTPHCEMLLVLERC